MPSDEQLMRQLVHRDQSALESLYDRHSGLLYSVALQITRDAGIAEELLQDIFFQLWRKASQFDRTRGSLIGWLVTIARNRAISVTRDKRRQFFQSFSEQATATLPATSFSVLDTQIARELVATALDELTAAELEAITLAYFQGLTCQEIAVRTNAPLGTTKSRLRHAVKAMKKILSNPNSVPLSDNTPKNNRSNGFMRENIAFER
jgi:RNA polymerase sigma-70 factor, ECF subfamily